MPTHDHLKERVPRRSGTDCLENIVVGVDFIDSARDEWSKSNRAEPMYWTAFGSSVMITLDGLERCVNDGWTMEVLP